MASGPSDVFAGTLIKTVSSAGTPVQLDSTLRFSSAVFFAKKAARTNNTGKVWIQFASTASAPAFEMNAGDERSISAPVGKQFCASDIYIDAANNGDGVVLIYQS